MNAAATEDFAFWPGFSERGRIAEYKEMTHPLLRFDELGLTSPAMTLTICANHVKP